MLSRVQLFGAGWTAAHQSSLSITISWSLLKLMSFELVMPSNHLILFVPFSLLQSFPALGSFPMSQFFASGGQIIKASVQHHSFQWISRTDFFKIDWLDILALQGTLKSFLQHHSLKASTLRRSAFFIILLSYSYMTTGKTTALTI